MRATVGYLVLASSIEDGVVMGNAWAELQSGGELYCCAERQRKWENQNGLNRKIRDKYRVRDTTHYLVDGSIIDWRSCRGGWCSCRALLWGGQELLWEHSKRELKMVTYLPMVVGEMINYSQNTDKYSCSVKRWHIKIIYLSIFFNVISSYDRLEVPHFYTPILPNNYFL